MSDQVPQLVLHDVIGGLRALIRPGAATGISPASVLLQLPVISARVPASTSSARRMRVFLEVLETVCRDRLQGVDQRIAPIVFGLGDFAGQPISHRYALAADTYHAHWSWESFRKEPLTRLLETVAKALEREAASTPLSATGSAGDSGHGLVGHDWVMDHYDVTYRFPDSSSTSFDVLQRRRLRALRNDVQVWRNTTRWRERGEAGSWKTRLFGEGRLEIIDQHRDELSALQLFETVVTLPRALAAGDSVDFTLHRQLTISPQALTSPDRQDWYGLLKLPAPVAYARIALQFGPVRPQAVWRHQSLIEGLVRPGDPDPDTEIPVDGSGYAAAVWTDLSPGMSYGLSIRWH